MASKKTPAQAAEEAKPEEKVNPFHDLLAALQDPKSTVNVEAGLRSVAGLPKIAQLRVIGHSSDRIDFNFTRTGDAVETHGWLWANGKFESAPYGQ